MDAGDERGEGGSSPHTRGAPAGRDHRRPAERIIPAYAGSTFHKILPALPKADHPRIRGEHQEGLVGVLGNAGSSPHTRGARLRDLRIDGPGRIIPAYAGSTRVSRSCHSRKRDHPRIRGEHFYERLFRVSRGGSSPHTRGAQSGATGSRLDERIIPAYAGSTRAKRKKASVSTDHPRIRGEHRPVDCVTQPFSGSSPHTRGALTRRGSVAEYLGIIPAYAGSTPGRPSPAPIRRDHPRIRGEHSDPIILRHGNRGSSPHTRGAPSPTQVGVETTGIIPAYAGSTCAGISMM